MKGEVVSTESLSSTCHLPAEPQPAHHADRKSSYSDARSSLSCSPSTASRQTRDRVYIYEKVTPPSSPGGVQRPPSCQLCLQPESPSIMSEKSGHAAARSRTTFEVLTYVLLLVPWLSFTLFFYNLLAIVPLLVASSFSCCAPAVDGIMSLNYDLFDVHRRRLYIDRPKSNVMMVLFALTSLPAALLVAIGGLVSMISSIYSLLLSEKDNEATGPERTMSVWYAWLRLFANTASPADHANASEP